MADPRSYRPAPGEIPLNPGVYRFREPTGRVIYVGKAKSLRSRLNSYFADPSALTPKTRQMVTTASSVEWTVVGSELEALQLEYTWIKEYAPRFNIMFRDDKSYPYLAISMNERFPRVQVTRGDKRRGVKYFGPFYPAKAIRETMDTMLRVFPVRSCAAGVFNRAERSGRPCLLGYIGKCSAPCVGRISQEEHRELAEGFAEFMNGRTGPIIRDLTARMKEAAASQDFELAARLRDDLAALTRVFERNAVVLADSTNADLFAFASDELESSVQVFHVRDGRIRGQRGWVTERVEDISDEVLVAQLLLQVYSDMQDAERIPAEVLVPVAPDANEEVERALSELRGSRVVVRVPRRGEKLTLLETVKENAEQALALHKSRRSNDLTQRSAALTELQEALGAPEPLMRIECYDVSHVQGTNVVASMTVVEDGLPRKGEYRRFSIRGEAARDDTASMYDVIRRRFSRLLEEEAANKDVPRFGYRPNLVVVDGGPPQVAAAVSALEDLGIEGVSVVGLAKRLEEVWLPEDPFPLVLPRASQGLYLLQRIRDEAHRFAIAYHRTKRSRSMTASALDDIPGLGPARKTALIAEFGSVAGLRAASADELMRVKGVGPALAETIAARLAAEEGSEDSPDDPSEGETAGETEGGTAVAADA
ncbi:excinuclease ABC subunit UvrC [Falsarthrobacter nasiphocae]|uniref:UvrABC system protein C n=1 Tax=Falsarthrobacter nasiphocae TaxID=189863 RepID=A0AAE3YG61_9MICC|nr:excinuclease ABC subunit UvrC [Falsarthrobacter nasiphocae]MDR6891166.1 excinuclease ABC subunit C [Falsarthrobacter nasiphocae]